MALPVFIGEGGYGCLHSPPLKCKDKERSTDRSKVSKILYAYDAKKELNEYELISKIDKKKQFHLGKPSKCVPDKVPENVHAVNKCEQRFLLNDKSTLLIMENGGVDLDNMANIMAKSKSDNAKTIMQNFWGEALRLFKGLELFLSAGIMHHDLKGHNLIYSTEKNRVNFIDFGFMEKIETIKKKLIAGYYEYAIDHWSYPSNMSILEKNKYMFIANRSIHPPTNVPAKDRNHESNLTRAELASLFSKQIYERNVRIIHAKYGSALYKTIQTELHKKYIDFINTLEPTMNEYTRILNKTLSTFDSFGLAIGLTHLLYKTKHLIDNELYIDLKQLFDTMLDPNPYNRGLPFENTEEYERILQKHGIPSKFLSDNVTSQVKKPKTPTKKPINKRTTKKKK